LKKVEKRLGSKEKVTTFAPATTAKFLDKLRRLKRENGVSLLKDETMKA